MDTGRFSSLREKCIGAHKPLLFLKAGDHVALGSRLLGERRRRVVAYDDETMGARCPRRACRIGRKVALVVNYD